MMRKEVKKRLGSILVVLALMFSMVVLITQSALAASEGVSKTLNLTYGETIWVNVSGLTPDDDYEVWIWDTTGWETNISEDTADAYGRVTMEVEVPYRYALGDYPLIVIDVTGVPDPGAAVLNQTIQIYNTYTVKVKVDGNEVYNLMHNRTYEYGGDYELSFEFYNGSDFINDWTLEATLYDPEGTYVDNKTVTNGKWIPNIVTFDYVGDLPNREIDYWLEVVPSQLRKAMNIQILQSLSN